VAAALLIPKKESRLDASSSAGLRGSEAPADAKRAGAGSGRAETRQRDANMEEEGEARKRRKVQSMATHRSRHEVQMKNMVDNLESGNIISEMFSPPRVVKSK
jgi:hypothetical protein